MNAREQAKELWLRFRNDPCLFVGHFWSHIKLAGYQAQTLESVRDNTETWVHSANEMGKSLCAALTTIWWFATRKSKVITISPSQEQLESILWAEIDSLLRSAHVGDRKFSFGFDRTYLKLRLPGETESEDGEEKYTVRGKVVKQGESLQGSHLPLLEDGTPTVLCVVEEASGVPDEFFTAIETQRHRSLIIGKPRPLGPARVPVESAKLVLRLLVEGNSIRATERITGVGRNTICRLLVYFGDACRRFLDNRMRGLTLTHLQFDEQWTYVAKKQSRLTVNERETTSSEGDIYLWTCVDQQTKLMPAFRIGKRTADNARRFMLDVAGRLVFPKPHASDEHAFAIGEFKPIVQISTDAFAAYPEAVDLAFGPYAKYGTIIKEYRNAKIIYTPSEMVGTRRTARRGMSENERFSICTSHVERLNGTQRLFLKRLNRLTYCFSKKLRNLEAAFACFAAYYNYCWRTRKPGKTGKCRPTAATMAGLTDHTWSFDELFGAVLA